MMPALASPTTALMTVIVAGQAETSS